MKPRQSITGVSKSRALFFLNEWLRKETHRRDNLQLLGDFHKIKSEEELLFKSISAILDQHDKLVKYARIVIRCHENPNFNENVAAIESYLVDDLQIEL